MISYFKAIGRYFVLIRKDAQGALASRLLYLKQDVLSIGKGFVNVLCDLFLLLLAVFFFLVAALAAPLAAVVFRNEQNGKKSFTGRISPK